MCFLLPFNSSYIKRYSKLVGVGLLIPSVPARNAGPDFLKNKNNRKSC